MNIHRPKLGTLIEWMILGALVFLLFCFAETLEKNYMPYDWLKYLIAFIFLVYSFVLFTTKPPKTFRETKHKVIWTKISVLIGFILYSLICQHTAFEQFENNKKIRVEMYEKQEVLVKNYFEDKGEKIKYLQRNGDTILIETDENSYYVTTDDSVTVYKKDKSLTLDLR